MSVFSLTIAFMSLAIMLSIGVIYSRLYWLNKSLLLAATTLFVALFYIGFSGIVGYPVAVTPPAIFRFLAAQVREPNAHDGGAIYLWIIQEQNVRPRAIEVPYSKSTRDQVAEAKKRVQAGLIVYMGAPHGSASGESAMSQAKPGAGRAGTNGKEGGAGGEDLAFVNPIDTVPKK